jgi:integrase
MESAHSLPRAEGKRPSIKLSTAAVRALALPDGKRDYTFFDQDLKGFGVRVRESGSKTFVFVYKVGSKVRRIPLGSASAIGVNDARKGAERLYARVKLGEDPAHDKADARIKAADTFKALVDKYLAYQRSRLRPRSYPDVEHHLLKHAKTLHGAQVSKITRRDVAACLSSLKFTSARTQNGAATKNRVRDSISGVFSWAIGEGLVEHNPVIGVNRSKENIRERVLDAKELRLIWQTLPGNEYGAIVKLLLLTGQREGEIAGLLRSELREDAFILPGSRTKNHREHLVPLSAVARAIIDDQLAGQLDGKRDLIFGRSQGPFSGWSKSKKRLDAAIESTNGKAFPHWQLHDLRRSFATHAAGIGIQPHILESILNHQSGFRSGVAGIYNRATYDSEKRTALDRWAEHLLAIVEGRQSNVMPLSQRHSQRV